MDQGDDRDLRDGAELPTEFTGSFTPIKIGIRELPP